ncbi:HNH endonuclease signature motif containing protein [Bradyrhizobium sp. dw_78]|uniref:HNH endonuclease signature motif containing protein n=1 Tax=Bradyrhizobium sp. dw_78 TaxID=2719793 RepID=UPI001BD67D7A|nr:HNH endonuclease signature motif containing protein [Bradyrhizobium sp. dw_78]
MTTDTGAGLTAERARELLSYDEQSGELTWRVHKRRVKPGTIAGTPHTGGYISVKVDGRRYYAHRLAFLIKTGRWPSEIDHIDGSKSNRWSNLREATRSQNLANRRAGRLDKVLPKGVALSANGQRYLSAIYYKGVTRRLGSYTTPEEAHAAFVVAAAQTHGEFARAA